MHVPTKRWDAFLRAIEMGLPPARAAAIAGLPKGVPGRVRALATAAREAMETGAPVTREMAQALRLADAWEAAEAKCIRDSITMLRAHALNGAWQAVAWLLERRWPDEWAQRSQWHVDISDLRLETLSDEEVERLGRLLGLRNLSPK